MSNSSEVTIKFEGEILYATTLKVKCSDIDVIREFIWYYTRGASSVVVT